jgi:predicted transcriptional regulator
MKVRDIMSHHFVGIARNAAIRLAAVRMRDLDLGMLPVEESGEIVGTVTDRDITVRGTASGADPDSVSVGEVMSNEIYTCVEDDELHDAARIMEEYQVRRLMVQDSDGRFIGMLTLADVARHHGTEGVRADILKEISQPAMKNGVAH